MPKRTRPPSLKEVCVLVSDLARLRPEQVAERTPFTLVRSEALPSPSNHLPHPVTPSIDRASSSFLGWTRLHLGLKSSSAQRRKGIWLHREDWVWAAGQLNQALETMAAEVEPGQVVAVAVVSAPVQLYEGNAELAAVKLPADVRRVGPPELPTLKGLQWLVLAAALETGGNQMVLEIFEGYLLVKEYTRAPLTGGADRRGWRTVKV